MKKIFLILGVSAATWLCGSGCSYFMLWQISGYDHDETRADREMRALEEERALRMQGDSNYTDQQINAVMQRSSVALPIRVRLRLKNCGNNRNASGNCAAVAVNV